MCQDIFYRKKCMMNSMAKKPHILSSCAENHAAKCPVLEPNDLKKTWFLEPETGRFVDPSFVLDAWAETMGNHRKVLDIPKK